MDDVIRLAHGSGGEASRKLVGDLVETYLKNDIIDCLDDSAVLSISEGRLAFTTDSYVVDPIFFPGGDIGSLAVHGTVNDLAMAGAKPLAITLGLILEEGLKVEYLRAIMGSVSRAAAEAGVMVVGGDTKVVERGSADGIFINTSGIGMIPAGIDISSANARPRDRIILSGTIGDHGVAVMSRREGLSFKTEIKSDSAPLNGLVEAMLGSSRAIRAMRDPTRGGLATSLNEIASKSGIGLLIDEAAVPLKPEVEHACEMLGLDPLYVANEGKLVAFVPADQAEGVLAAMRKNAYGRDAAVIGEAVSESPGTVILNTAVGGKRILSPLSGELLPRIC
ncbi:MAG: hydrogenase expression/formation protein HypE [bacterium]|jgi:hydrogenase expression/formation protein HypE